MAFLDDITDPKDKSERKIPTNGNGLARFRRLYKLSQKEFGLAIGYTQGRISQLEAGGRLPKSFQKKLEIWEQGGSIKKKVKRKKEIIFRRAPRSGKGLRRLLDQLEVRGTSKAQFAGYCGMSLSTLEQYLSKKDGDLSDKFRKCIEDFLGIAPRRIPSNKKKLKRRSRKKKKSALTAFENFLRGDEPLSILRYNPDPRRFRRKYPHRCNPQGCYTTGSRSYEYVGPSEFGRSRSRRLLQRNPITDINRNLIFYYQIEDQEPRFIRPDTTVFDIDQELSSVFYPGPSLGSYEEAGYAAKNLSAEYPNETVYVGACDNTVSCIKLETYVSGERQIAYATKKDQWSYKIGRRGYKVWAENREQASILSSLRSTLVSCDVFVLLGDKTIETHKKGQLRTSKIIRYYRRNNPGLRKHKQPQFNIHRNPDNKYDFLGLRRYTIGELLLSFKRIIDHKTKTCNSLKKWNSKRRTKKSVIDTLINNIYRVVLKRFHPTLEEIEIAAESLGDLKMLMYGCDLKAVEKYRFMAILVRLREKIEQKYIEVSRRGNLK